MYRKNNISSNNYCVAITKGYSVCETSSSLLTLLYKCPAWVHVATAGNEILAS